jgi:hypothetical protein
MASTVYGGAWVPTHASRRDAKPHDGRLFYERRFGVSWEDFERHARAFRREAFGVRQREPPLSPATELLPRGDEER